MSPFIGSLEDMEDLFTRRQQKALAERIATLDQQLAEVQAAKLRNDQCYRELADVTDNLRARWVQAEAERGAARAALGRAVTVIKRYPVESGCNCPYCRQKQAILADPQGQQAAAEWQAMQAFVSRVRQLAASWSDMVGIPRDIKDLLAELDKALATSQQPLAAGEGQDKQP